MWVKQGCIFNLSKSPKRGTTHAQVPTVLVKDDRLRIYFAKRDINLESYISYFDLERKYLKQILGVSADRVMDRGVAGAFDSDGTMPSCVIPHGDELWLYYIGWNAKAKGARYQNEIGLAVSRDGGRTFNRKFPGPIMGRTKDEYGIAVMPFVMYKNWYHCWYQSGTSWNKIGEQYEPVYVLNYAESINGIDWKRENIQSVDATDGFEAFSRPTVIFKDGQFKMWHCYRGSEDYRGGSGSYRIGYAESCLGRNFVRMDHRAGIELGAVGEFDSEMQAYPYVIEVDGRLLMFYNGNGFGQSGIGMCIWQD